MTDPDQIKKKKKSGGFQSLNLIPPLFKAVMAKGYNVPTPIQRKVIPFALDGRDIVACSRTGSGKTAAFLLPLINKLNSHSKVVGVRALIICPTRELALQISSMLRGFAKYTDLVSALIVGGHGFEGQFESLASNPDIIIATPGRLGQHLLESNLTLSKVEMLIFDEADYLFEMGFADQIDTILSKVGNNRQCLLFSATIPEELSNFTRAKLKDYVFCKLDSEYTLSENIKLHFMICRTHEKLAAFVYLIKNLIKIHEKSIVFASTKYHVDLLVSLLKCFNLYSVGIYGKMDQLARKEQLSEFSSGKCKILIVTDLAARGIDIPFVNNVIHFDYPAKPKLFIHRSGRTARAGKTGTTYCLMTTDEVMYITEIMLYVGRALSNEKNLDDNSKAFYGSIPINLLGDYIETINRLVVDDEDVRKYFEASNKAFKQFKRTRRTASKSSAKKAYEIDFLVIHPLLADKDSSKETKEYIEQIKNYKPQVSYLEYRLNKDRVDVPINEDYVKSLSKFKNIEAERLKREVEGKQLNPQDEESNNEDEQQKGCLNNVTSGVRLNKKRLRALQIDNGVVKKVKKKDLGHYVAYEPEKNKKDVKVENSNKITAEDINPFFLGETLEDFQSQKKKKIVWDKTKKKYVRGQLDEKGRVKKDKEDKFMKDEKGKKLYKSWSKKNVIALQRDGEMEDTNISSKAKSLFMNRVKKYGANNPESDNNNQYNKNNNQMKKQHGSKKIKKELRTPAQILKIKQKKKNLNFKNMEKGKRRKIISKNHRRH